MATSPNAGHLNWRTVVTVSDDAEAHIIDALDTYFALFAQPAFLGCPDGRTDVGEHPCLNCGEPLAGSLFALVFGKGGFEWGLVHGEGHCRNCGWPARTHHFIKDKNGEDIATLRNVILQYHPDFVERKAVKVAAL